MLRHPSHPSLCPFHARAELQLRESHGLGAELATTISGDFMTATDISHALGKLYTAVAQDRIPPATLPPSPTSASSFSIPWMASNPNSASPIVSTSGTK